MSGTEGNGAGIRAVATSTLRLPVRLSATAPTFGDRPGTYLEVLMVRLDTDDGLTGWGEAFAHDAIASTRAAMDTLVAPRCLGQDASDGAGLMDRLQRQLHFYGRSGPVAYALAGLDIALWDIAGKRAGRPLWQMFGGRTGDDIPAYASLLRYNDPDVAAANARRAVADGFEFVKLHESTVAAVAATREAVGPHTGIMLDTNCPWSVEEAIEAASGLRPCNLLWLEEPTWPPEDHDALARVRASGIPVAAGENVSGCCEFRRLFELEALDVAQPSVTKIGITEFGRVITLAESFGVRVVPHNASFGAGSIANQHLVASLPAGTLFERLDVELEAYPFGDWQRAKGGAVRVPRGPGLGCDPDPDVLDRYRVGADTAVVD